jgi:hypothetical protein
MNNIEFGILGPHWKTLKNDQKEYIEEASLIIKIDGLDLIKSNDEFVNRFEGAEPASFLFNKYNDSKSRKYNVFNGEMLIGVCSQGRWEGEDDLLVDIITDDYFTKWRIFPKINISNNNIIKFIFNKDHYNNQIKILENEYFSYSWEDNTHRIVRMCNEFAKKYTTKNGDILSVRFGNYLDENRNVTDKLTKDMTLFYHEQYFEPIGKSGIIRPSRSWEINWDGKNLDNALESLEKILEKEFILR